MSVDNGIYILRTNDGWRVAHLQAIDNIYYWPTCCDDSDIREQSLRQDDLFYHEECFNCGQIDPEFEQRDKINPSVIFDYFKDSFVFETEEAAMTQADIIYKEITEDDFCGIVEYGIQKIHGLEDCPFPTKEN